MLLVEDEPTWRKPSATASPGGDRGRHRRRRRRRAGAAERQRLRHRRPRPRHPRALGDEIARRIVASGSGMPILMLTAADRLDDKATGFELGADDYLTKPFELQELVLRLRALDRRRAHNRPPVREIAGLRLDPFRREVHRDGRYVALTSKQFAVLEVLVAAEGGVVSAEELLERAWDQNADPFTNAVRITSRHCANASASPGSSPPWPAPGTASTPTRHRARGRRPWIEPLV